MRKIFALLCITVLCFSFFACSKSLDSIDASRVEKVFLRNHDGEYELTEEESKRLIELYNASYYEGEATGGGGTPDFGVSIYFNDQIQFQVNEFAGGAANGSVFEVFWIGIPFGSAFYVKNDEMYSFIKELIDLYI